MKRTFPTRAGLGGTAQRMETRLELRATARTALHETHAAGTKLLKHFFKAKVGRKVASIPELHKWRDGYMQRETVAFQLREAARKARRS